MPNLTMKNILRRVEQEIQWREHLWRPVGLPRYTSSAPLAKNTCMERNTDLGEWYTHVLIDPKIIGALASSAACTREVIDVLQRLEPDPFVNYLLAYYQAGLLQFGDCWRYADIATVLLATSKLIQPQTYLEIGVRRGRSLAMVAATCPQCSIIGFDMWMEGYSGMENPGPDFVRQEIQKIGFKGSLQFVNGDSHRTIREYFQSHPDEYFDLITVDGDHSQRGASLDLRDVLPRLKVGGVIVFDDIVQPRLEYLQSVWRRYVADRFRFATWEYGELGYGIAIGVRKY
jgi:predicted O-methyltransferase YrrM